MKFKKLLAVALSAAMVMGMATVANAATINVTTPTTGTSVTYTKLIAADPTSTKGWSFVNDDVALEFAKAYGVVKDKDATTISQEQKDATIDLVTADYSNTANIANGAISPSAELGKALKTCQGKGETASSNVQAAGLYEVVAEKTGYTFIPMAVYVDTTKAASTNSIALKAKGAKDQVSKTVEAAGRTVKAGETVKYTVTVQYPYYSADEELTDKVFTVEDTLTNGTFVNTTEKPVTSSIGTPTISVDPSNKLTLTYSYTPSLAGQDVTITYYAKANDSLSGDQKLENEVKSTIKTGTTTAKIISDTAKVTVKKYASTDFNDDGTVKENATPLSGATFKLYTATTAGTAPTVNSKGQVSNGTEIATAVYENGTYTFDGLDAGTYYVVETVAPTGYTIDGRAHEVVVSAKEPVDDTANHTITYDLEDPATMNISDTTISALPSTGGIGTTMFTIAGVVIIVAAAGIFFASRKKRA